MNPQSILSTIIVLVVIEYGEIGDPGILANISYNFPLSALRAL